MSIRKEHIKREATKQLDTIFDLNSTLIEESLKKLEAQDNRNLSLQEQTFIVVRSVLFEMLWRAPTVGDRGRDLLRSIDLKDVGK